ncbi:hypothetical protein ABZU32_06170 [Sphaerisporangium sp. NPDC005288]|uniref:hypothetical protein n=1 Tax=Sphaerisporangium sp. NPDC005288 TaxID=3155114 RepID=UPI0033AB42DB
MVWKAPTSTELQLQSWLGERGLHVSLAKIRRWREYEALPWPQRQALGYGRGSASSELTQDTYIVAEALALATRRKQRLDKAVLQIFFVHPRHEEPFIATRLPLPEAGVRKALEWSIANDRDSVIVKMERAMAAEGTDGDQIGAALDTAHRHFHNLLRQQISARRRNLELPRLTFVRNADDATALADIAVAALIPGSLGSDMATEAIRGTIEDLRINYKPDETLRSHKTLFEAILDLGLKQELGELRVMSSAPDISTSAQIETIRKIDYARICIVRDLLAVLAEAALPLRIARRVLPDDPVVTRVMELRAQYAIIDYCLHHAEVISRGATARAWVIMTRQLITLLRAYASDEMFGRLRAAVIKLDPVLDELPVLIERVRAQVASS